MSARVVDYRLMHRIHVSPCTGTPELRALARTKMFRIYHGKHRGATFEDVMHNDRSYVHSSLGPLVPLDT